MKAIALAAACLAALAAAAVLLYLAPPQPAARMDTASLAAVAAKLAAPGKGILAADESTSTIGKRLEKVGGLENTEVGGWGPRACVREQGRISAAIRAPAWQPRWRAAAHTSWLPWAAAPPPGPAPRAWRTRAVG